MLPVIPGDPYYPELPVAYNPIPPIEETPMQQDESEIEEDPKEDMEKDPEEELEEDMDVKDNDEVIMIIESESSVTPPSTQIHSFTTTPRRCPKETARMSIQIEDPQR
ncbi:unnamed protein product [Lactuca saligna]|uniref:Uncharacterized protein n=1 Tax=Lactuca saligna TaxID=75948 RepID=A0AA36A2J2_LACSI|nr:unnamed protein product [Lactuca saligna]